MPRERKAMPKPKAEKTPKLGLQKFIKKAPRHQKTKKEKNTYQFIGFFDRLKSIDVKVSHASLVDQSFMFDNLQQKEETDLTTSNFIQLIKQEKVNNCTLEFRQCWKELEPLAYSFPLVVINKNKIVSKLVFQLQNDTLKVAQPALIELVIALIKDLRQDIYPDFLHDILPAVISILDCTNLVLLDSVFSLLSFSFKYLLNPIRENLSQFYSIYVELLFNKNKFVRKFAAQSFSYIFRKVKFTKDIITMICDVKGDNQVMGAVELLFEICSGEADQLHSKSNEVLTSLLQQDIFVQSKDGQQLVRILYLRLLNTIDTRKQLPMYEILTNELNNNISLMGDVLNDTIKLKFGKRVSNDLGGHLLQTFNLLIKQQKEQEKFAESLSLLYYFHFENCKDSKLFSTHLFSMSESAVEIFLKILLMNAKEITTETDLEVSKILDLKSSNKKVEFSYESHKEKCQHLVQYLNKWTLKQLSIRRIQLLLGLIHKAEMQVKIEIGGKCVQQLKDLLKNTTSPLDQYIMAKFISATTDKTQFTLIINKTEQKELIINLDITKNIVLNQYPSIDVKLMLSECLTLIDVYNQGFVSQLSQATQVYLDSEIQLNSTSAKSLFVLKQILLQNKPQNSEEIQEILGLNLSKNSRELRIISLKVLLLFKPLEFLEPNQNTKLDQETISRFYSGQCPIINLLLKAEESEISLENEKLKANILRKVQLLLQSELVPDLYVQLCYRYALGCFWVKFTPLHQNALDILQYVFKNQIYLQMHLTVIEQLNLLLQLGEDNDTIIGEIQAGINQEKLQNWLYLQDTVAEQDFVQIKDFQSNIMKALHTSIDFLLSDQQLRSQIFNIYLQFMDCEFIQLHFGRRKQIYLDFQSNVIASNLIDSQEYKQAKRIAYHKLIGFFELFSKSSNLNKLNVLQTQILIEHYMELFLTADDKLQKLVLTGLLKVSKKGENKTVKLPKYAKLLEGLLDDVKFKEMITVIAHGQFVEHDNEIEEDKKTNSIPKLAQEDRQELLPFIVKLLFSKLLKKKGSLNSKSLMQRRTIVFQFLSGLEPVTEFPIFFKELLQPLGIKLENLDQDYIRQQLQQISFSKFIQFIGTAEIIFTQLGILLNRDHSLTSLTNILVLMLAQSKKFLGTLREDTKEEGLYQFVQSQCQVCVRKGLKILKQLYSKFSHIPEYAQHLSKLFYNELVQDQVQFFKSQYASDKAQLIELVTIHWSSFVQTNYLHYPEVLPALMQMLHLGTKIQPQVFTLHLTMLKNLVLSSFQSDEERVRYIEATKVEDSEMDSESKYSDSETENEIIGQQLNYSQVAKKVLQDNISAICEGLHMFWTTHSLKLRSAILGSRRQGNQNQSKTQIQESIALTNGVRDLTFIMSELSVYIIQGSELVHSKYDQIDILGFLDMMVGLISQKHLLSAMSSFQQKSRFEELLMFGLTAVVNLLSPNSDEKIIERIFELFLQMQSKKARELLAKGLHACFQSETTSILVDLNTVKKGFADVDYDYDKVLTGIKSVKALKQAPNVLIYCLLHLLQHQEYSVREYSLHALSELLDHLDERLFKLVERQIVINLKQTKDEMIMKTMLLALRALVANSESRQFKSMSQDMRPLINEEHDDFFTNILSMQLPQRLKALRKLQTVQIQSNTFNRALLPLVDYLIFDMKNQMENRRNTIRYSRDQSNQLQEESLSVYTTYAMKLTWGQYMSLVRKLLYKINKATRAQNSVAAQKQDNQNEKVICKCLCKVLDGFNFADVPDAVLLLQKQAEEKVAHKFEVVDYSDFLKDLVGNTLDESESSVSEHESSDNDVEMVSSTVGDIQQKLHRKVLPLLQRHILQTKGENTTIRSFVAVSIAKVIRKLPVEQFSLYLQKLINLIVVKGLREKDLNTREKARKSLIKVIKEVSPRFLSLILQEMGNNLNRGFQLHVYLYTVHYVFNYMKDEMKTGQVTNQMIKLLSPLLLREMFGDLLQERQATEETAKKHIKESKARKAMPIYEVLAQFSDFKTSFLELIQPIVKVLEENPSHSAIQMTEDLLARISNSLLKNTSITGVRLLPFIRQIIERGVQMSMRLKINDEKAKRDYGAKPDASFIQKSQAQLKMETHEVQIKWTKTSQLASDRKTQEICGRVLANFGLQTLKKALNQKGLVLQGDEHEERQSKQILQKNELVEMLDPFVQPLLDSFKTFYNPIVVQTLQIMIHVIHLGLPSFKLLLRKFLNRIFLLFSTNTSQDNDFTNSLFKCTSELIRTYSVYNDLSETQIKTLVLIIKQNLQNYSTQSSVFTCLKAILYRRFQSADLYDLITNIQDMMVTSVQQSTRYTCAQIFITFILEYPMEDKRLNDHIQHLLKNLSYFDQEGRLQLLETLQIIIEKMPEQRLSEWQDLIFLTLFLRLVNEQSNKCREIVTTCLEKLIMKSSKRYVDTIFQMQAEKEVLVNGKLQFLALLAKCGKLQNQDIQRTIQLLEVILDAAAIKVSIRKQLSKDSSSDEDQAEFLQNIGLDHEVSDGEPEDNWSNAYFAMKCLENILMKWNSCALTQQIKSNVITLSWKSQNYWVRLSCQRVISFILTNTKIDDSLKFIYQQLSVYNFTYVTELLCQQLVQNLQIILKNINYTDLVKVFKKASYIGRRILGDKSVQTSFKQQSILQFYKSSIYYLKSINQLQNCTAAMLEFVYRTYTDEQLPAVVRDPSTELVDLMSESLDKDNFIKIFNEVQMSITQGRTERKIKDKMLVASEDGMVKLAKKRANKMVKKKEKHKQKVLMNQLTR